MTNYKELKKQAKNLTEITRFTVMELRNKLEFTETITMLECKKIAQQLNPLTKRQKEVLECFGNDWHHSFHRYTKRHDILMVLVAKGYLRTRNNENEFTRIIPLTETEVE